LSLLRELALSILLTAVPQPTRGSLSASFSGLTLGLMGLDQMGLRMVIESGESTVHKVPVNLMQAGRSLVIRRNPNTHGHGLRDRDRKHLRKEGRGGEIQRLIEESCPFFQPIRVCG